MRPDPAAAPACHAALGVAAAATATTTPVRPADALCIATATRHAIRASTPPVITHLAEPPSHHAAGAPATSAPNPEPFMTTSAPHRLVLALLATIAALLTCAAVSPPADAEEVFTSQAAAAHATDSTWIPAPAQRAALCLVDTGVTPNPDTTNVIARFSVDNGPPDDLSPDHHGTLMAMIASAPYNGFGMVGAAPSINVVSVRASRDGRTFGGTDIGMAMQKCINYRAVYNIKVISLSLGGAMVADLDGAAMEAVENNVDNARRSGISVVAAAGNHSGPVDWPAAYPSAVAVGARAADGAPCTFAATGAEVDLWAPGCPVDVATVDGSSAWASGSSEATAFVSAVLCQIRQLKPDLSMTDAESSITTAPGASSGNASLDVDKAFRMAGLGDSLELGRRVAPAEPGSGPPASRERADPSPSMHGGGSGLTAPVPSSEPPLALSTDGLVARSSLPGPKVKQMTIRSGVLSLVIANRPHGARVDVALFSKFRGHALPRRTKTVRRAAARIRTRVIGTLSEVSIRFVDPTGHRVASTLAVFRPRAGRGQSALSALPPLLSCRARDVQRVFARCS